MRYRVSGDRPPARRCALRRARRCAWLTAPARGRALFGAASSLHVSRARRSHAAATRCRHVRRHTEPAPLALDVSGRCGRGGLLVVCVQAVEGGALRPLFQLPAALIVLGGTCLATLVTYPPSAVRAAFTAAWFAFREDDEAFDSLGAQLVTLSVHAHRGGPAAIDQQIQYVRDPFLRNGLTLLADGVSLELLRDSLAMERLSEEGREDLPIRLLESAAGSRRRSASSVRCSA